MPSAPTLPKTWTIAQAGTETLLRTEVPSATGIRKVLVRSYGTDATAAAMASNDYELSRELHIPGVLIPEAPGAAGSPGALRYDERGLAPLAAWPSQRLRQPELVAAAARSLLETLGRIHTRGVLHLAVNPCNVLARQSNAGTFSISGFGRALRSTTDSAGVELTSYPLEFWPYLSPEQTGRTELLPDARSDYYSLGATLYFMATGRPPVPQGDAEQTVYAILARRPRPLDVVRPDIPPALCSLVMRLLSKDPDGRPASVAEALRIIEGEPRAGPSSWSGATAHGDTFVGRRLEQWRIAACLAQVCQV